MAMDIYGYGRELSRAIQPRSNVSPQMAALTALTGIGKQYADLGMQKKREDIAEAAMTRAMEREYGLKSGIAERDIAAKSAESALDRELEEKQLDFEKRKFNVMAMLGYFGPYRFDKTKQHDPATIASKLLELDEDEYKAKSDLATALSDLQDARGVGVWNLREEEKLPEARRRVADLQNRLELIKRYKKILESTQAQEGQEDLPPTFATDPEGRTYFNPLTGQRAVKRGGRLVPLE